MALSLRRHMRLYSTLTHRLSEGVSLRAMEPRRDQLAEFSITQLDHGLKVITEQQTFPGLACLGFLLKTGTRDESPSTQGALSYWARTASKLVDRRSQQSIYGSI